MSAPSPLVELTLARLRLFFRDPSAVFWTYGFPLALTVALGIAFRSQPPAPITAGVLPGEGAPAVLEALARSPDVRARAVGDDEGRLALRAGKVDLLIRPGPPREYVLDPTRPEARLARSLADDALQRAAGRTDPVAVADKAVTEPGSRYIDFLVPGLIGMNVMSSGMWGIGYVIVEMRTRKLLKRLVATPMRRSQFLLSFVMMRMLFLLLELPILLGFAALFFSVPVLGSLVLLATIAILGALAFSGLGLLVASRAENTQTVSGLINLVMMPMFIGSGVFFSTERFPAMVRPFLDGGIL